MKDLSSGRLAEPAQKMYLVLLIASAMCFIGHGAFGIITKPIWCNYFAVFGIGHDLAYRLMPIVGSIDILLGVSLLLYPVRIVPAWLVCWALVTASLRPLSGESFGELIERAGNFGAPLALLLLTGPLTKKNPLAKKNWFSRIEADPLPDQRTFARVTGVLRIVVFLLLVGHGWLNWIEKKSLLAQYAGLGFPDPGRIAHLAGIFEFLAAFVILVRPMRSIVLVLLLWKIGTELFYPHYEVFEWIERCGSYGSLLALWLALGVGKRKPAVTHSPKTLQTI
jgi:uncharacterized membrane protein YphA (DoxX/SURF4 family)